MIPKIIRLVEPSNLCSNLRRERLGLLGKHRGMHLLRQPVRLDKFPGRCWRGLLDYIICSGI